MRTLTLSLVLLICAIAASCTKNYHAISMAQARTVAPFQGTVEKVHLSAMPNHEVLLLISLRKQDGSEVRIMQFAASTQDVAFAKSLRQRQKYDFPKVLLEYDQKP